VRYAGGTLLVQPFHVAMCFPGVGAYFQKCAFDSKCLEVRAILPGGPVEHNGCIEVGDILLEVISMDAVCARGSSRSRILILILHSGWRLRSGAWMRSDFGMRAG
jgi:hypothetical protein